MEPAGRRLRVFLSDGIGRRTDGCTAFKTEKNRDQSERTGIALLHWPQLDADLYVPALIEGAFGSRRWMQHIGELGGSARSAAKAKASRENGLRPPLTMERAAAAPRIKRRHSSRESTGSARPRPCENLI